MQTSKQKSLLDDLYAEYWEYYLKENPTTATYLGDHRYDNALEDISSEAYERRVLSARTFLEKLRSHPRPSSSPDRLSFELFERVLSNEIEEAQFRPWLMPITQLWGPHIDLPQLVTFHPFQTTSDFENFLTRLRKIPRVMDQAISCMKTGIAERLVLPRTVVEKIPPQIEAHVVGQATQSEFNKPITTPPTTISFEDSRRLRDEFEDIILRHVVPAYRRLNNFVKTEYLKAAQTLDGLWALPDGAQRYAFYVRYHTTTNLTPEQINELGQRELSRNHTEMRDIMRKVGFKGTLQQFIESVR